MYPNTDIGLDLLEKNLLNTAHITKEDVLAALKHQFLQPNNKPSEEWLDKSQSHNFETSFEAIQKHLNEPNLLLPKDNQDDIDLLLDIEHEFSKTEFELVDFKQQVTSKSSGLKYTTPANRNVAKNFVRGNTNQALFMPGGIEMEKLINDNSTNLEDLLDSIASLYQEDQFKTILPGLERGIFFEEKPSLENEEVIDQFNMDDLMGGFDEEEEIFLDLKEGKDENLILEEEKGQGEVESIEVNQILKPIGNKKSQISRDQNDVLDLLIPEKEIKLITTYNQRNLIQNEWAHKVKLDQLPINYNSVVPKLAHEFPFELDLFQKHAVYHLEAGNSVFLAAHTSAGKTVVAEYAIALAMKHVTRVIYTSPIKALSNQKYRDFKNTFDEVGLLTGDAQINPEASCLIMTTEILRSMLYRGADIIRDVEFVIFDEVHYINDLERGVVWEEVIILLPSHINIILLSATVPNALEFAEWIGRMKKKEIFVISTMKRPVPLEHFIYAKKELFKIVDKDKTFIEAGWKAANDALCKTENKTIPANNQRGHERGTDTLYKTEDKIIPANNQRCHERETDSQREQAVRANTSKLLNQLLLSSSFELVYNQKQNLWTHMIDFLKKQNLLPVIIFTFSKRRCDSNASNLPNLDLTTNAEKSEIQVFVNKSINKLAVKDRTLPQVLRIKRLLRRGISVHHSGLLPIIKEMIEILFSKGLIKVLFATETFAMGINMPARSVVFNSIKKHDGTELRYLLPGEYIQMSGRAGRRGLDNVGTVIIACPDDQPPDMITLKSIILGKSNRLSSQFRLTFNMILNLLRVEALKVEEMIKHSFAEYAGQQLMPRKQAEKDELNLQLDKIPLVKCDICKDLDSFLKMHLELRSLSTHILEHISNSTTGENIFCQGRVVLIDHPNYHGCLGVIIKASSNESKNLISNNHIVQNRNYLCFVSTNKQHSTNALPYGMIDAPDIPNHTLAELDIEAFSHVTKVIIEVNRTGLLAGNKLIINQVQEELLKLSNKWNEGITINEQLFIDLPKVKDIHFYDVWNHYQQLKNTFPKYQATKCPDLKIHFNLELNRRNVIYRIQALEDALHGMNLELLPEYFKRLEVLKYLGFSDGDTVTLKGRVACEINSVNELVVTELILDNFFSRYDTEEAVALLSSFLFQEKGIYNNVDDQKGLHLTDNLIRGCKEILVMINKVADAQIVCGLNIDIEEYKRSVDFGLVHAVYEWARGMSFNHITTITDIAEGSIVRTITRLNDTCRDVRNAARLIGDNELYAKMEEGRLLIKRDIVFATSLYF